MWKVAWIEPLRNVRPTDGALEPEIITLQWDRSFWGLQRGWRSFRWHTTLSQFQGSSDSSSWNHIHSRQKCWRTAGAGLTVTSLLLNCQSPVWGSRIKSGKKAKAFYRCRKLTIRLLKYQEICAEQNSKEKKILPAYILPAPIQLENLKLTSPDALLTYTSVL